jgi:uncharacterized protein (TIGR03083 family)
MQDRTSRAYGDAAQSFVETVALIGDADWDAPGLGEWSVRELVAHANRSLANVVEYVEHPQPPAERGSGYFSDEAIAARARDAAVALGGDPAGTVAADAAAAAGLVERSSPDTTVGSPMATLTLAQYLPSRTAELVVHTLDVARALDREVAVPPTALEETLLFLARRAAGRSDGQQVVLALTGREPLLGGYSVF